MRSVLNMSAVLPLFPLLLFFILLLSNSRNFLSFHEKSKNVLGVRFRVRISIGVRVRVRIRVMIRVRVWVRPG